MSDIETGKKWVSGETLTKIAKALKAEIFELFKPDQETNEDIDAAVITYLDDVDAAIIKSIEKAVKPAVKRSVMKMREYWAKENNRE
jgi:transcriptional regulator with XRE-family HTH domain